MNAPLAWTTAQWHNEGKAKILAHTGTYGQFAYGTHTPSRWSRQDLQLAIVCSPESGVIAIDVDDAALFLGSQTARIVSRSDAATVRSSRFHIYVDARYIARGKWPRQGPAGSGPVSWGDIKSNGFVAAPGCTHHTGMEYIPTGHGAVTASAALIEALMADRASYTPEPGQSAGNGGGHDGQMMSAVIRWILDGHDREACFERWCAKAGKEENPSWPYENQDFERHYRSAERYAGHIAWKEEQDKLWWQGMRERLAGR